MTITRSDFNGSHVRSAKFEHSFIGYDNPQPAETPDEITRRDGENRNVVATEPAHGAYTARSRGDPTRSGTGWREKNRVGRRFFAMGKRGGAPGWLHSLFCQFRTSILSGWSRRDERCTGSELAW
jgi:hypothetical protein